MQRWIWIATLVTLEGCMLSDSYDFDGFQQKDAGSGGGDQAGSSGQAGSAGPGGAGAAGDGGSGGQAGDGVAGDAGNGGVAGESGAAGEGGVAGDGGTAGDAGNGGMAGESGGDGGAGDGGVAGDAGAAGDSGSAGEGGMAGAAGGGGTAGQAGDGGAGQGGAGQAGEGGTAGASGGAAGDAGGAGVGGDGGMAGASGAAGCAVTIILYQDDDGDGYGVSSKQKSGCQIEPGWALEKGDCLDTNELVFPAQTMFFGQPYINAQGNPSYDYNCDTSETSGPGVQAAPANCDGASCAAKQGYEPSLTPGLGLNPLCGSKSLLKCIKMGASCTPETSTAPTPAGCR